MGRAAVGWAQGTRASSFRAQAGAWRLGLGLGLHLSPPDHGHPSCSSSRTRGACRSGGDTFGRPDGRCIQEVSDNGRFWRVMSAVVTEKGGGINIGISTGEGLRSRRILRAMWTGYPAAP